MAPFKFDFAQKPTKEMPDRACCSVGMTQGCQHNERISAAQPKLKLPPANPPRAKFQ